MPKKRDDNPRLFDLPPKSDPRPERARRINEERLWTGNKARLIQKYLVRFVQITKHGTYVDGFSGPQTPSKPESWSAGLVVGDGGPQLMRHFFLFEKDEAKVAVLEALAEESVDRDVRVFAGDFNTRVDEVLRPDVIAPREATFCLFDQRTFECEWSTVQRIADYKRGQQYKVEAFYFLAQAWLDRALQSRTRAVSLEGVEKWWGRDDYGALKDMRGTDRARWMSSRFVDELGYKYASHYEIYQTRGGKRIMYFMIHATDHPAAQRLMGEAYNEVVKPPPALDQPALPFRV